MPKIITTEDFIKRAKQVHGNKYDYSLVIYKSNKEKVKIVCKKHGIFLQEASSHKQGHGCRKCYDEKNLQTEKEFIKLSNKIHNNKFNYSKVDFSQGNKSVKIICPIHGEFSQTRKNHLRGDDCRKCASRERGLKSRITKKEFVKKARELHGKKYDYSKVKLNTTKAFISIICPLHGEFKQKAEVHYRHGCRKCGISKITELRSSSIEDFIKKANSIHENKYDYSKVKYKNTRSKIEILCPIHGAFFQSPGGHLAGKGCNLCGGSNPYTNESFIKESIKLHGDKYDYSKVEYKNAHTHVKIICPKHGEFMQQPTSHLTLGGCSRCVNKGEGRIAEILLEKDVFFRQYKIGKKYYDFFLPKYNLLIERDGEQHYRDQQIKKVKLSISDQHKNDKFKTKLAKKEGYKLARIPYWLTPKEEKIEINNILAGKPTYPDVPDLKQEKTKPKPKKNK